MAVNTASIVLGSLKIKYSPKSPIDRDQQHKLVRSVNMARLILRDALGTLDPVARGSLDQAPRGVQGVLDYHIYQRGRPASPGQQRLDLLRLTNNLAQMRNGLSSQLVIADAFSSKLGQVDDLMDLQRQLLGMSFTPEEVMERRIKAVSSLSGFVKPKTGYIASLTDAQKDAMDENRLVNKSVLADEWVPEISPGAANRGSIHLNFFDMLGPNLSTLRVARVILHEASHKFCDTLDHAYVHEMAYSSLTARQTLTNADSHAYTAVGAALGLNFKDDEQMQSAADYRRLM